MSATQTASPDDRDFRLDYRSEPYRDPVDGGSQSLIEHRPTYFDDAIDRWVNEGGALSLSGATYHTTASC